MSSSQSSLINQEDKRTDLLTPNEVVHPAHSYLPLVTSSTHQVALFPEIWLKIGSFLTDARDILVFFLRVSKSLFKPLSAKDIIQERAFETLKSQFPKALKPAKALKPVEAASEISESSPAETETVKYTPDESKDWFFELLYQANLEKLKKDQATLKFKVTEKILPIKFAIDKGYPAEKIVKMLEGHKLTDAELLFLFSAACFAMNIEIIEYLYRPELLSVSKEGIHFEYSRIPYYQNFREQSNAKLGFDSLKIIDISDFHPLTPIHFAIINGDVKKLERLLFVLQRKDKNISTILTAYKDSYEGTFLHFTALTGNAEMLKFLINRGVSPFKQDRFKHTPFEYAAGLGHLDAVRCLYEAMRPSKEFLSKVLSYVVERSDRCRVDNTAVVQFLLDKGADPLQVLKKTNFSQQIMDIRDTTYIGPGEGKAYKANQIKLVRARERLIKQSDMFQKHQTQKLNSIFIAADVKKEKNKKTGYQGNIYHQTACLFESLAEEGFIDWRGEKAFAKTISAYLRVEGIMNLESQEHNIKNCYDFIMRIINHHNPIKSWGTLDTLIHYLKNKADKIAKSESNPKPLTNDADFEENKNSILKVIETYLNERKFNDSFTQFKIYFFGKDSGLDRAITYKTLFEKAKSREEFNLILNALFQSKSETLKNSVRNLPYFKPTKNQASEKLSNAIEKGYGCKSYKIKNILGEARESIQEIKKTRLNN